MIFRRRRSGNEPDPDDFNAPDDEGTDGADEEADEDFEDEFDDLSAEQAESARPRGPWDEDEVEVDADTEGYIDLGGLLVKVREGVELRLHVEDQRGTVAAAMLVTPESGLELRAFAAPRSAGIWDEVRADIAGETRRVGGTCDEADGEFGPELRAQVHVQSPDGQRGVQNSRVVGIDGPRWMLRATFLGRAAVDPDPDGLLESALRDIVVVRGGEAMAPREPIPMHMPEQAREEIEAAAGGETPSDNATGDAAGDATYRDLASGPAPRQAKGESTRKRRGRRSTSVEDDSDDEDEDEDEEFDASDFDIYGDDDR